MKLVIDAGNSRIKWATVSNNNFEFGGAHHYKAREVSDLANEIWSTIEKPQSVFVANVAGQSFEQQLVSWVEQHWRCDVHFIKPVLNQCGVENQYGTPLQLGADRWADAIAAWHKCQHAVAIFDAGTSITLDIIDDQGNLLGGTISPGINMMVDSLLKGAVGLRDTLGLTYDAMRGGALVLAGKDTKENILTGCLLPTISYMEMVAGKLQQQYKNNFQENLSSL
jgi:type III pantothenate kinase